MKHSLFAWVNGKAVRLTKNNRSLYGMNHWLVKAKTPKRAKGRFLDRDKREAGLV